MSSIKIRCVSLPNATEVRLLISHPMENGRNRDAITGQLIPAHYIQQVQLAVNHQAVVEIDMGGSMAKNPYLALHLQPLTPGDRLTVRWQDNRQQSDQAELLFNDTL